MKSKTSKSAKGNASSKKSPDENKNSSISKLQKLFEDELKDIYWAEKALLKAIPEMIDKASSEALVEALQSHLVETKEQVGRLEEVFAEIQQTPQAKKCDAIEGLIKEAKSIMDDSEEGLMKDAGIISAAQKVEHYEIASYGTLRTFAQTLGLHGAAGLLAQTLDEERNADEKLTGIAELSINQEAANEAFDE